MNLPTTPPTRFDTWVAGLDGDQIGAYACFLVVGLFALWMASVIVGIVRMERASEVDVRTRPTTSDRKSGRVRA